MSEAPPDAAAPAGAVWRPSHNPWAIAVVVALAAFMEILDTSIANVALPHMAAPFRTKDLASPRGNLRSHANELMAAVDAVMSGI